jgi:uncharacterized protein YdaT
MEKDKTKAVALTSLHLTTEHIANALISHGHSESEAIAIAVNVVKGWAAGKPMGGEKKIHPDTQAAAKKALAEWSALKSAAHGGK